MWTVRTLQKGWMDEYHEKELEELAERQKPTWNRLEQNSRKYQIGKQRVIMAYMDSGLNNSLLFMTG